MGFWRRTGPPCWPTINDDLHQSKAFVGVETQMRLPTKLTQVPSHKTESQAATSATSAGAQDCIQRHSKQRLRIVVCGVLPWILANRRCLADCLDRHQTCYGSDIRLLMCVPSCYLELRHPIVCTDSHGHGCRASGTCADGALGHRNSCSVWGSRYVVARITQAAACTDLLPAPAATMVKPIVPEQAAAAAAATPSVTQILLLMASASRLAIRNEPRH